MAYTPFGHSMRTSPAELRRPRQREQARRAILDATEALLLEAGSDGFSMRRLAERCGYTTPTIYHYFEDKPALIDALLEGRFAGLLRRVRRGPRLRAGGGCLPGWPGPRAGGGGAAATRAVRPPPVTVEPVRVQRLEDR